MEERSLSATPNWAVATVVTVMVLLSFAFQLSLKRFGKWSYRTRRKPLYAALEKIKDELMLFGVLSLLMGHSIEYVAKICVKSSTFSSKFYMCSLDDELKSLRRIIASSNNLNDSASGMRHYCPEGEESFASHDSLEQLHRFIFVLGVIHVSYSIVAIALAMVKIYSWRTWENEAKSVTIQNSEDSANTTPGHSKIRRMTTFIFHRTAHPWSQHRVLVWLLCLMRQFWSSINRADYMALRFGFISTHGLPISYDFHNYMVRSMEEEFRDIVGISVPLWIYAIACIFLDFHGSHIYFWVSFIPAILVIIIGTKLHHVVVKLAVEIMESSPYMQDHQFNLRDELFWFGKPTLVLWLIQFISFLNAFEIASFIWSMWEIKAPSCFMGNGTYIAIRLTFGVISQIWCSFVTFPLYVIIAQMGSRFKKSVVSENVRESLHGWQSRVKKRKSTANSSVGATPMASRLSWVGEMQQLGEFASDKGRSTLNVQQDMSSSNDGSSMSLAQLLDASPRANDKLPSPSEFGPVYDSDSGNDMDDDDECGSADHGNEHDQEKDESCLLPLSS